MITGFAPRDAVAVAELRDGVPVPAGLVKFGLVAKDLWQRLDRLCASPSARSGLIPVRPEFGRYCAGWIRDGMLLSVG